MSCSSRRHGDVAAAVGAAADLVSVGAGHEWGALAAALGDRATPGRPLGPLTTYGVGGPAALYVEIEGPDDLAQVRRAWRDHATESLAPPAVFVLGRGSNLLVADEGFEGIVVHLGAGFSGVDLPQPEESSAARDAPATVRAGAAVALPVLARRVADAGWSGFSWAVGVPGSVGGAVRMNAGGHGSDMASCLVRYSWVDLFGPDGGTDDVSRLAYGYRSSSLTASQLVVSAELSVTPGSVDEEQAAVSSIVKWRRQHQPGGSNAGSVFTNPEGDSAGRLIEAAGLKGFRLGTAHVSEKHANFIQADKDGRADDVHALMAHVRDAVAEDSGIELRAEVRLLGFGAGNDGPVEGKGRHGA
jgi:UDP-N-acetylmuramate dehydrogenase